MLDDRIALFTQNKWPNYIGIEKKVIVDLHLNKKTAYIQLHGTKQNKKQNWKIY